MPSETPARLFNRDFVPYWLGIAISAIGDALVYVALPFLVLRLDVAAGSQAGTLATVMVLGSLPRFAGPVIGALADRLPLRLPLAAGAAVRALLFAAVAALALQGQLALWALYLAAFLNGSLTIFTFAGGNVALPHLVPAARLAQANSLMQAATMGLPLIGLGAGGALVATVGAPLTVAFATPCFLALTVCVLMVRFPPPAPSAGRSLGVDLLAGLGFLRRRPALNLLLVGTLVLNAALNLLNVLMPLLMERQGAGARGYGLFESLISAGTLLGIVAVTVLSRRVPTRWLVTASQATLALGFVVLASGTLVRWLAGGVVLGVGLGVGEVASITLLQLVVPDGMRGKVLGVVFPANAAGLALGAAVAGALGERVAPSASFLGAAALVGLLALTWGLLSGRFREDEPMPAVA